MALSGVQEHVSPERWPMRCALMAEDAQDVWGADAQVTWVRTAVDMGGRVEWYGRGFYLYLPGERRWDFLAQDPEGARLALNRAIRDELEPGWRQRRRERTRAFFTKLAEAILPELLKRAVSRLAGE